jgi:ribonuclease HI
LLKEYKYWFAWDYTEMPGLDRSIVEHRLPIKSGFRPHQQSARRCNPNILPDIKAEITKLIKAKFIRQCRYAEWISNVVSVYKKNRKLHVCIDFRNLNKAAPMDSYPMSIADLLIDAAVGHQIISFMDGNAGYNQIFMAEEDIPKTAFRCPGHVGLFEWIVMTFGLKNVGATYQRAMNFIFHEYIGTLVEIYIDYVVVKSGDITKHLADLRMILECTRKHGLKMNPNKCAFGVSAGQFLGFMVHQRGIEISRKSIDAINKVVAPTNKTELQSLIGKINFIRRFISNLSGKIKAFSPLLKLKANQEFLWGAEQQLALDEIKKYLTNPPVLVPPQHGKPFRLYLSTDDTVIGSALIQEFEGKEHVIYYLSRRLVDAKTRYSAIEKLCLCLYFSCIKLRHYLLSAECTVICKDDVVKYMLSMPILSGRIGKWILALSKFDLRYESIKAVKGQVMADFVTQHCNIVDSLEVAPWTLFFDGSTCGEGAGIGIVLISPQGRKYEFSLPIVATSINNQAEYQALIKGLELLREIRADAVKIFGDSMLIINQLAGIYECQSEVLISYYERCLQLLKGFRDFRLEHIYRLHNEKANRLAQHASGYQPIQEVLTSVVDTDG